MQAASSTPGLGTSDLPAPDPAADPKLWEVPELATKDQIAAATENSELDRLEREGGGAKQDSRYMTAFNDYKATYSKVYATRTDVSALMRLQRAWSV